MTAAMAAEFNNTGGAVSKSITVGGQTTTLDFTEGAFVRIAGSASLTIDSFAVLSGSFRFEKTGASPNMKNCGRGHRCDHLYGYRVRVPRMPGGVQITGATLGLVIIEGTPSVYALYASGTGTLVGYNNFSITATLAAEVNKTGAAVNETVTTSGGDVTVSYDDGTEIIVIQGTGISLGISGFVSVTGDFGFEKTGTSPDTVIRAGARNVTATLQSGSFSVEVSAATLGLVLNESGAVALEASGALAISGGEFASVTATSVLVRYNTTGALYTGQDSIGG